MKIAFWIVYTTKGHPSKSLITNGSCSIGVHITCVCDVIFIIPINFFVSSWNIQFHFRITSFLCKIPHQLATGLPYQNDLGSPVSTFAGGHFLPRPFLGQAHTPHVWVHQIVLTHVTMRGDHRSPISTRSSLQNRENTVCHVSGFRSMMSVT